MQKRSIFLLLFISLTLMDHTNAQSPSSQSPDLSSDSVFSSQSLICTLSEPELRKRKGDLQKGIFSQILQTEELEKGYSLHFPDEKGFALKLVDYVLAERACCPFFQFNLQLGAYQSGIQLDISGPEGVKEMMGTLFDEIQPKSKP